MSKARDMPESQEQQVTGTELASVDKVCTVECAFHMLIKVCYLFIIIIIIIIIIIYSLHV
jgi:membrane protein required for beta-lactamase induction